MYVCVCNALNERKVAEAIAMSPGSVARVYKHHGCAPQCGKCVPVMRDMVRQAGSPGAPEPQPVL
ncbi:MAG: bacterioferritin-associated ferredoxin [Alphaproteobacteria bacterium]